MNKLILKASNNEMLSVEAINVWINRAPFMQPVVWISVSSALLCEISECVRVANRLQDHEITKGHSRKHGGDSWPFEHREVGCWCRLPRDIQIYAVTFGGRFRSSVSRSNEPQNWPQLLIFSGSRLSYPALQQINDVRSEFRLSSLPPRTW